jgi:serine/threonine protein kinase
MAQPVRPLVLTKSSAVISELVLENVGPHALAGTGKVELRLQLPLPHSPLAPAPSTTLGNYEIVRKLAYGGMAELALAKKRGIEGFEKLVVLKRILPQYAENPKYIQMFLDEARLQATLEHPHIVQVHDIGVDQGNYFFAMEYVRGQDLRHILKAAARTGLPLPLEHALHIVTGIASALHYAHAKRDAQGRPLGIVHRDVSPSNVLVTYDGAVKLVDFGIARAERRQSYSRVGALMGKAAYMAPEQCRGETLDRRTDVFALGTMLYELTCGKRPFQGRTDFTILHQIATQDPEPPSSVHPGYPADLETIVLKALRRSPQDRYSTAEELQVALEGFARDQKLVLSSVSMAQTMRLLFVKEHKHDTEPARAPTSTEQLGTAEAQASRDAPSQADTLVFKASALRLMRAKDAPAHERRLTAPPLPAPVAALPTPASQGAPPTETVAQEPGAEPVLRPWLSRYLGHLGVALLVLAVGVWASVGPTSAPPSPRAATIAEPAPPSAPSAPSDNDAPAQVPEVRFTALPAPVRHPLARQQVQTRTKSPPSPRIAAVRRAPPRPTHAVTKPSRTSAIKSTGRALSLARASVAWDPDSALPPRSR